MRETGHEVSVANNPNGFPYAVTVTRTRFCAGCGTTTSRFDTIAACMTPGDAELVAALLREHYAKEEGG